MLYKKNSEKVLSGELFKNPTSEYRGAPFWAWNCKMNKEMLTEQIEILKEMGFGGFHMHSRTGMDHEYLGEEFMELVSACVEKMHEKTKGNILIISHQERILNIADKIVVIADGKVDNVGKKEDILPKLLAAKTCKVLSDKM